MNESILATRMVSYLRTDQAMEVLQRELERWHHTLAKPCTFCGAQPGNPCHTRTGNLIHGRTHVTGGRTWNCENT